MSQLRNLLTNKVLAHKLGGGRNLSRLRRNKKSVKARARKVRSEITEQRALAASQYVPKSQPNRRPGLLRRVGNFLNRAFKGA